MHPFKTWLRLAPLWLAVCLTSAAAPAGDAPPAADVAPVFHASFRSASDAAAADQSLVLLVLSADWCVPCKLFKSQTLAAPEFARQKHPLHVAEVNIDANQKMAANFGVENVPALVLLTADGKILLRHTGFLSPEELLEWLKNGRFRASLGQWEGTAPGAQFDEYIKKAATDSLGTNDLQRLVELLGDPDPANRTEAGNLLAGQRDNAVPQLIAAVGHPYLGVRISATELLQRLAPDPAPVDPWQSPAEISNAVLTLQKWWAAQGHLPAPTTPLGADALAANSIQAALAQLRADDPQRRTAAMTALVNSGPAALPAVRAAL
ncbi:MAG TPA: thioredoxin domain-containing protein, partial [Verrucomicrobiae bacterium]